MTMLRTGLVAIALASLLAFPLATEAQQRPSGKGLTFDVGKTEYDSKCATCHGLKGRGDGPTSSFFAKRPTDLTRLAAKNGGILPISSMYDMIIGDKNVPAHGDRYMPVWGPVYSREAAAHRFPTEYDIEAYVRARILFLIEYINRLQTK